MARVTRRQLIALATAGAIFGGLRFGKSRVARAAAPTRPLSEEAKALIAKAWGGLDPKRVLDVHVHVIGTGAGGTGCMLGERLQSLTDPLEYLKLSIYLEASGVDDLSRGDQQYLERLRSLISSQSPHGRALLFAFDHVHDEQGVPQPHDSEFFTPNEYVLNLARAAPELFVPCASIHPYRPDAVDALDKAVAGGAVAVKWLPNAMKIDPSSARCDAFYDALARLGVPLITHAGEEKAVHAEDAQRLGNPLHLRRPLGRGVKVIVAHCASLGQNPDLDAPSAPWVDNFDLFLRLMAEPQWEGRLFGELAAIPQVNRLSRPLETLLARDDLQRRLVNGSDYPLPAINALVQTSALVKRGFLTEDERALINEINQHDPLLMDFVIKRTVRMNGRRLADEVFMIRPELFPRLA
jgi:mannonate dehydratase